MRHVSFSAYIHATRQTVWELMVNKVDNPENYLPGVEEATVLERHGQTLVRQIRTRGMTIRERVTIHEERGEIEYQFMEHPLLIGRVVNRLVPTSVQSPVSPQQLTIEVEWAPKDDEAEGIILENMPSQIQQEVLSLKERAEDLGDQGSRARPG